MATILVIDDDAIIRSLLARILSGAGHVPVEAKDGRDALRKLQDCQPAVIVTDIVMPEMDGIEFIRTLRRLAPTLPVIAISGGTARGGAELFLRTAKALGADAVLEKPFRAETFLDAVRTTLSVSSRPAVR